MTVDPVCVRVRLPLLVTQIASEMRVTDMTDTNVTEAIGPDEIAEHEDAASASISDANEPETDDIDSGDEEASQAAAKPKRQKASSDAPKSAGKAAAKSSAKSSGKSSGRSSGKATATTDDISTGSAMGPSSAGSGSDEMCEGELVWYNERKGYGFVRIGEDEVFLHRSTLDRFGLVRLLTGDIVAVSLSTNEHGQVIKDLLSVKRPLSPAPPCSA
jgi:cold shock CspA family protein